MHSTKISPVVECLGQRSRSLGQKRKIAAFCIFCLGVILWGAILVLHFFWHRPRGRFYAGGKISTCCLVYGYDCLFPAGFLTAHLHIHS